MEVRKFTCWDLSAPPVNGSISGRCNTGYRIDWTSRNTRVHTEEEWGLLIAVQIPIHPLLVHFKFPSVFQKATTPKEWKKYKKPYTPVLGTKSNPGGLEQSSVRVAWLRDACIRGFGVFPIFLGHSLLLHLLLHRTVHYVNHASVGKSNCRRWNHKKGLIGARIHGLMFKCKWIGKISIKSKCIIYYIMCRIYRYIYFFTFQPSYFNLNLVKLRQCC